MSTIWKFNIAIWLLDLVLIIISLFFVVKIRGWIGETTVKRRLKKLPPDEYKVINNLLLPYKNTTTQIDHVVVSLYGIFVLETKYMKGSIYGNEKDHDWTKYSHGRKMKFRNPFHQNYGHLMGLVELSGLQKDIFTSMVIFVGKPKLKIETGNRIYSEKDFIEYITGRKNVVLDKDEMCETYEIFCNANVDSLKNRKKHVADIKDRIAENEAKIDNGICPHCGGKLVARNGKYGPFYGCSNYPKCRFTADIKGL